jgi:hypothetical protein
LDALPVQDLRQRIRSSVEQYMDMGALEENKRIQAEQGKRVHELTEEIVDRLEADNQQDD